MFVLYSAELNEFTICSLSNAITKIYKESYTFIGII